MPDNDQQIELEIINTTLQNLLKVDKEAQIRLLRTIAAYLQLDFEGDIKQIQSRNRASFHHAKVEEVGDGIFSKRDELTPKQFLLEKDPRTDIERVACLAYYLTHYRNTPYFKTLDISLLNTEAAQPKFANATYTIKNAISGNLLASASGDKKQLSGIGEQFVQKLPDREAARIVLQRRRTRRGKRDSTKGKIDSSAGKIDENENNNETQKNNPDRDI